MTDAPPADAAATDADPSAPPGRRVTAAVALSGPDLHYAEVVRHAGAARLRRLGAVDFAFDAEQAVFGHGDSDALASVGAALAEVLDGTEAQALVVAAHPTRTTSFFTPLPEGVSESARDAQLRQETALLADLPPTLAVRVRAVPVRSEGGAGGARRWYHVVHVGEPVHVRLSLLAGGLGVPSYDVADTTRAVAPLATGAEGGGVDVVVGAYREHVEVALCRAGELLFAHGGAATTSEDTAYYTLSALQHAGLDAFEVGRLLTYGTVADGGRFALAAQLLDREPAPLDPFAPFGRQPGGDAAELAAFAPVLGAAL